MCLKALQLIMISADNHDITRLLLLTIIVSGKKCSISIIDRQNIPITRQNRLIAHPYFQDSLKILLEYDMAMQDYCRIVVLLFKPGACQLSSGVHLVS